MTTIILASLLFSAVSVHAYPLLSHSAAAPVYSYGSHGHHLSAHDSHGSGIYGSHGHQRVSGIAAHDSHAISSHGAHKAYEAEGDHFNKYKNVGAYSHEKGEGFEKTYHYEKANGHHDIIANDDTYKASYGDHGEKSYHESRAHVASGHKAYGSHNKYGANSFGSHGHLKSTYGKFGPGHNSQASSGHLLGGYPVGHGLGKDTDVHQGYSRYPVGHGLGKDTDVHQGYSRYPVGHGLGKDTDVHQGYSRYPVAQRAEYVPSHGSNHGYSKVFFKGPGYGYHY